MTVIAAFVGKSVSAIGSDTDGSNGWIAEGHGTKVYMIGGHVAAGFTGSYLVQRWVRDSLEGLLKGDDAEIPHNDHLRFQRRLEVAWASWRSECRGLGIGKVGDCGSLDIPGALLVLIPGKVFMCQADGSVLESNGYGSVGAGSAVALGSLATAERLMKKSSPSKVVKTAIKVAIRHVPSCGGHPVVLEIGE